MTSERVARLLSDALEVHELRDNCVLEGVQTRLEWEWGLNYQGLDEHLGESPDTDPLLDDNAVVVLPHRGDFEKLSIRDRSHKALARRPHISQIYAGQQSFNYFVLPLDPTSTLPARRVDLATPPHVVLISTGAKLMRVYGEKPIGDDTMDRELVQRIHKITEPDPFSFTSRQLELILHLYAMWTRLGYIPPTFKSGESDATLVEEASVVLSCSPKRPPKRARSPASDLYSEPQRRVTASELEKDFNRDSEDDDSGSEIEEDSNPTWAADVQQWADTTSHAAEHDDKLSLNEILDDVLERPRTFASVDLGQPDYLKHKKLKRRRVEA
ncbi:hypothetical protein C8F01DRAFT_1256869 [Mycena amicta]|nr:hypothetical protein C8F01DRAFT_1256869 [Mycena amicta]